VKKKKVLLDAVKMVSLQQVNLSSSKENYDRHDSQNSCADWCEGARSPVA
jgi:hypothetical protein